MPTYAPFIGVLKLTVQKASRVICFALSIIASTAFKVPAEACWEPPRTLRNATRSHLLVLHTLTSFVVCHPLEA